jgi:hypothetical protein
MEYLHEDQYFTCSSGLAPAKMSSTQTIAKYENKHKYLTKQSTATSQMGDFFCRWTVVLAAAIAALGIVTGGAALLVLGAAAIAAGGLLCGFMAAPFRKWIGIKNNVKILGVETLTARAQMTCPIGGTITVAPGITGFWSAAAYTARNTAWAIFEGYFIGKTLGAGGSALVTGSTAAGKYFIGNFLMMQGLTRTIGAVDQVVSEGMLRDGQSFGDAVSDKAIGGLTMFEQPFINIYKKLNGQVKDADGNEIPLNWQDFYGAALSALGTREMARASMTDVNMPKESVAVARSFANKVGVFIKGRAFETPRVTPRSLGIGMLKDNSTLLSIYEAVLRRLANSTRDNIYKRYLEARNNNFAGMTREQIQAMCEDVWKYVRSEFGKDASKQGITIDGEVHHWNYPKYDNPRDVLNPNQLTEPISRDVHEQAHRATTSDPSNIWEGPINNDHAITPEPYNFPEPPLP